MVGMKTLSGRAVRIRSVGKNLTFVTIRSLDGDHLCVFSRRPDVQLESILEVSGEVKASEKSHDHEYELVVDSFSVVSENRSVSSSHFNGMPYGKSMLPLQHVYMRRPEIRSIFEKKWAAIAALRQLLSGDDFFEVQSPRIVGKMADGPTLKFKLDFFGSDAYLSLSNLLYHTAFIAGGFDSVFEVSPLFRADMSKGSNHLSEFLILEVSAAYRSREDLMDLSNRLVKEVCSVVDSALDPSELRDIPVVTYRTVCEITERSQGSTLRQGERIKREHAMLVSESLGRKLFWVTDMPAAHKAFFSSTRPSQNNLADVANDFRLFWDGIDIVDGGERVHDSGRLRERLLEQGLDPSHFEYYLDVMDSAVPPFTGFGLGIERLLAKALMLPNIRQLVAFPRFVGHHVP